MTSHSRSQSPSWSEMKTCGSGAKKRLSKTNITLIRIITSIYKKIAVIQHFIDITAYHALCQDNPVHKIGICAPGAGAGALGTSLVEVLETLVGCAILVVVFISIAGTPTFSYRD